jgi:hypothetical protein
VIEMCFRLLQRKLLQPHSCTSSKTSEQAILAFMASSHQIARSFNWPSPAEASSPMLQGRA